MRIDIFKGNENRYYTYNAIPGLYRIECWGGKGYDWKGLGGNGGYASGYIKFKYPIVLYVYPGGKGIPGSEGQVFNGGGRSQSGGGGGSDVRLIEGNWNDLNSLISRIIVAGGGGGADSEGNTADHGGAGGGLKGVASSKGSGQGGTQTAGGSGSGSGSFGQGGSNNKYSNDGNGAGGGGYFGGGASSNSQHNAGGGGSSFVSGHPECNAVDPMSTDPTKMIMLNKEIHYSGYAFYNTEIINGASKMPKPNGGEEIGHSSFGVVKISLIYPIGIKSCPKFFLPRVFLFVLIPLIK